MAELYLTPLCKVDRKKAIEAYNKRKVEEEQTPEEKERIRRQIRDELDEEDEDVLKSVEKDLIPLREVYRKEWIEKYNKMKREEDFQPPPVKVIEAD